MVRRRTNALPTACRDHPRTQIFITVHLCSGSDAARRIRCFGICARREMVWRVGALAVIGSLRRRQTQRRQQMRGAVLYGARDVRVETLDDPSIQNSTDAIIRLTV